MNIAILWEEKAFIYLFIYFYCLTMCPYSTLNSVEWQDNKLINWKGYGRQWPWPNVRHYPAIYLEKLRNTANNLRTVGVPAEIRTGKCRIQRYN